MFDPTSRYAHLETGTYVSAHGRTIVYVKRRFVPPSGLFRPIAEITTRDDDRLDLLTARMFGDPLQYWRICDANDALDPPDLVAVAGRKLIIPSPI